MSFLDLAQSVLNNGITAYSDIQQAKYQANEPTPNQRGANNVTAPVGSYALSDTLAATFSNPLNLVLIVVAVGGLIYLLRKR
jgi:hypothetical protein